MKTLFRRCAAVLVGVALSLPMMAIAGEKALMPQTRGMAGMDPALHDQWEQDKGQDPYRDCTANAEARARQARHPMPQTRGMAGMDPRLHEFDCPQQVATPRPKHGPRN